jgi:hypothetical protein
MEHTMAIESNHAPEQVVEVLHQGLGHGPAKRSWFAKLFAAHGPERFLSMPHRVAYLRLDEIRSDADLRSVARFESWRFLLHEAVPAVRTDEASGIALVGAATVHAGTNSYSGLSMGPLAAATEEAIRRAENHPRVKGGSFEAILLIAPAVYVIGLWLRDLKHSDDFVMPIPPVSAPFRAYEEMSPGAFLTALNELADKVRGSQ